MSVVTSGRILQALTYEAMRLSRLAFALGWKNAAPYSRSGVWPSPKWGQQACSRSSFQLIELASEIAFALGLKDGFIKSPSSMVVPPFGASSNPKP